MDNEIIGNVFYILMILGYSALCSFTVRFKFEGNLILPIILSFISPFLMLPFTPILQFLTELSIYRAIYISIVISNLFTVYIVNRNYNKTLRKKILVENIFNEKRVLNDLIKEKILSDEVDAKFEKFGYYKGEHFLGSLYNQLSLLSYEDIKEW